MEREFGEKSFKPAPFNFNTIFSGKFNREYRSLFSRKLPGQILMSAYYTPMTVRELAIELGVASVYLEDEIEMLVKYNIISKRSSRKYQTNIVIFTGDFTAEFYKNAEDFVFSALAEILSSVKGKLGQVRGLNHICKKLSDERLLWSLLWFIMLQGNMMFENEHYDFQEKIKLYENTTGTNYGVTDDEFDGEYGCYALGCSEIDENYYVSAADFTVLPKCNRYFEK